MRGAPTFRTAPLELTSAEAFTLMYGSIVRQLISDFEDISEVNKQLDQMGYNIGIRLIDEYLVKTRNARCNSFRETAEAIAKQALHMFLNFQATVAKWNLDETECSLIFYENPFSDFVELPDEYRELKFCNILCGVIRGALEMINVDVECAWLQDMLKGDDCNEVRLKLKEYRNENFPYKDDD
mmetsp:Transcript_10593/g.19372  ORF Transcript_10593/g.19372 Transcript_10593/m.19372 type:complete len:183 (-) Transcript_10593:173-721(-)|eukprot:CAMPEP_0175046244 /NCGR_PEP_ID=MMETSP0052_2-20121109/4920_1 /TAXON_ID=51329 ORGANISM="Polytomella parva, Strain SAG 63-3" /NCGR_SAMPLE_ID=MMETSP0052_2 /ASSEMBLY_ACC=CAM_ASM_000194 /LENGTH=182 /DNA_ID=CAMNT_0016309963 /DNA_START=96 /DNA_END=644 /DNA_ORIENTATION=+